MYQFILGIIIFASILLILVVLAQNAKGGGLSSQFGGSGASNIMGVKKTGDLLERLTWSFIIIIMVLALTSKYMVPKQTNENDILERAGQSAPAANHLNLPADSTATPIPDSTQGN